MTLFCASNGTGTAYPSGTPGFSGVHVALFFAFCVVFCRQLFGLMFFFFWHLYCLVCPSLIYVFWLPFGIFKFFLFIIIFRCKYLYVVYIFTLYMGFIYPWGIMLWKRKGFSLMKGCDRTYQNICFMSIVSDLLSL